MADDEQPSSVTVPPTWHDLISARGAWTDAPYDDEQLQTLLIVAQQQVEAFAPALADDALIPANYRLAQITQARNLWNATKVDAGTGALGTDDYVIQPKPLDWHVKGMLRPRHAVPGMF